MARAEDIDYSNIEFINDQERQYFAEAHLGEIVRDFLVGPVGRYLHGRAKTDLEAGRDKLATLDPTTIAGVAEWKLVKQDMAHAETFIRYCAEAIGNGDMAAQQLEEYR